MIISNRITQTLNNTNHLYVSYTLVSLTQQHLNEVTMSNDQAAEILVELNENNVEYEAPINQVEKFKMD